FIVLEILPVRQLRQTTLAVVLAFLHKTNSKKHAGSCELGPAGNRAAAWQERQALAHIRDGRTRPSINMDGTGGPVNIEQDHGAELAVETEVARRWGNEPHQLGTDARPSTVAGSNTFEWLTP